MRRAIVKFSAVAALAAVALPSQAALYLFYDFVTGSQEVPPNGSTASGVTSGWFDDSTMTLQITTAASGLTAATTASHIHIGPIGVAGPVVFNLGTGGASTTYFSQATFNLTASQANDFLSGLYYVNIHNAQFPAGEIRGQLQPRRVSQVPGPAAAIAFIGGALAVRRRRKA